MQQIPIQPLPRSLVVGICCVLSLPSVMFTPGCMFSPTTNNSFPSNWHLRDSQHHRHTQDLSLAPIIRSHTHTHTHTHGYSTVSHYPKNVCATLGFCLFLKSSIPPRAMHVSLIWNSPTLCCYPRMCNVVASS